MFEIFKAWFNDPMVQGLVLSPLIGAILGVLFGGLNSPPPRKAPVNVHQTVVVFRQTIVVHKGGRPVGSQDDGWAYLLALAGLVFAVTWGYSRYATEILGYWLSGLFCCTAFILSAGIGSAIRGQYSSAEWGWYIFAPMLAVGVSFYLVHVAQVGILPGAREAAQRYGFIEFYLNVLKQEHRIWLLLQIAGVLFGILATIAATFRSIHYLALMNQRASGAVASVWHSIARATLLAGRKGGVVLLVVAAFISYLMLSGGAYGLIQGKA